jgi:hypothetical protein
MTRNIGVPRKPPGKGDAFALLFVLVHLTFITYYRYNRPVTIAPVGNPCIRFPVPAIVLHKIYLVQLISL